jgi:hypothetical protein
MTILSLWLARTPDEIKYLLMNYMITVELNLFYLKRKQDIITQGNATRLDWKIAYPISLTDEVYV